MTRPTTTLRQKFLDQFRNVTQESTFVAIKYWISHHGNLTEAIDAYFASHPKSESFTTHSDLLFAQYADTTKREQIGPEGVERLCHDMGIEPVDPEILVFAYHSDAKEMGIFTKEEFSNGLEALDVNPPTIETLKNKVTYMRETLKDLHKFRPVYQFLFNFAKDPQKKHLAIDECLAYWELLLQPHFPLFDQWKLFCESSTTRTTISKDTWMTLWDFATTIKSDLSDYDFNGAWPVMIDEFVSWYHEKEKQQNDNS